RLAVARTVGMNITERDHIVAGLAIRRQVMRRNPATSNQPDRGTIARRATRPIVQLRRRDLVRRRDVAEAIVVGFVFAHDTSSRQGLLSRRFLPSAERYF